MKPTVCKHCGAVDQHHSFQCFTQRKPIKKKGTPIGEYTMIKKDVYRPETTKHNKSIKELKKLAVIVFNRAIRQKACGSWGYAKCMSCDGTFPYEELQCGHYMPSTYSELKFNEDNTGVECEACNCMDKNHLVGYRKNLIKKIGLEKVEWLESHKLATEHKWTREELQDIIDKYK